MKAIAVFLVALLFSSGLALALQGGLSAGGLADFQAGIGAGAVGQASGSAGGSASIGAGVDAGASAQAGEGAQTSGKDAGNKDAQASAEADASATAGASAEAGPGIGVGVGIGAKGLGLGVGGVSLVTGVEAEAAAEARVKAKFGERLRELRGQAHERLLEVRVQVGELRGGLEELKKLKAEARLTAEQKAEFKAKAFEHVQASFDERIRVAQRLELEGADESLVAGFVAFAEAQKAEFANASTNEQRRNMVLEFNQEWREFKQAVARGFVSAKITASIERLNSSLQAMKRVIARMKARGTDVARLEEVSAKVEARLQAAVEAETLKQALWRVAYAREGLVHLRAAIQAVLNSRAAAELKEESEPPRVQGDAQVDLKAFVAGRAGIE